MRHPNLRIPIFLCLFSLILLGVAARASSPPGTPEQDPTAERFDAARLAWDTGDFVRALDEFKAVLKSPDGLRYFESIALITGELFQVREVTPDGRAARISPDGKFGACESGAASATVTRVFALDDPSKVLLEIKGRGFVFSPTPNGAAYLRVAANREIDALRKDIEQLSSAAAPDRQVLRPKQIQLAWLEARAAEIVLLDLATKKEKPLKTPGLLKSALAFSADGKEVYFVGAKETDAAANEIYAISAAMAVAPGAGAAPRAVTSGPGFKANPMIVPGGKYLIFTPATSTPFPKPAPAEPAAKPATKPGAANPPAGAGQAQGRGQAAAPGASPAGGPPTGGQGPRGGGGAARQFAVLSLIDGRVKTFTGSAPAFSADGSAVVFVAQDGTDSTLNYLKLDAALAPAVIKKSTERIGSAALAPDGSGIVFDMTYTRNGEIFYIKSDSKDEVRVSREIQPDRAPRFLNATQVVAIKGESRHSRAHLYDLKTLTNIQIFHNPTIRTISPEYEWVANPAGTRLLVAAERDGDTISGKRGLYLVELTKKISTDDLLYRMDTQRAAESALRAKGERTFKPIKDAVRTAVDKVSITKIYDHESALFDFDSKYITLPGNKKAAEYIFNQLKSFGYVPEYQEFDARGTKTANVLARLPGTENPDVLYVLSGHFDSNQRGPGADDDTSVTAINLEAARILAKTPQPYTIIFAFFTGEEAGLLGSREFVRVAKEKGWNVAADFNNDMIGWTNDHHLDDTIRFTSPGLRDIQHAAAFLFSRMITYDVKYVKSTDGASFYDAYGEMVSGLGSYPVLGNPYYHQPTDLLETVNHQLLVEAAKYDVASIMMLASSPTPVKGLKVVLTKNGAANVEWAASAEKGISGYVIEYGLESNPAALRFTVKEPKFQIPSVTLEKGEKLCVAVKAVSARGIESWEWARTTTGIR
jgi:Tol biopolymer transport system component